MKDHILNTLTRGFSAKVGVPTLQPRQQLLGTASVTLLANNLSNVRRFVLVDPQQRRRRCVGGQRDIGTLC